jgi:hypothetical protein
MYPKQLVTAPFIVWLVVATPLSYLAKEWPYVARFIAPTFIYVFWFSLYAVYSGYLLGRYNLENVRDYVWKKKEFEAWRTLGALNSSFWSLLLLFMFTIPSTKNSSPGIFAAAAFFLALMLLPIFGLWISSNKKVILYEDDKMLISNKWGKIITGRVDDLSLSLRSGLELRFKDLILRVDVAYEDFSSFVSYIRNHYKIGPLSDEDHLRIYSMIAKIRLGPSPVEITWYDPDIYQERIGSINDIEYVMRTNDTLKSPTLVDNSNS